MDGAFVLQLFGDAATELLIRHDGDEGLFLTYSEVMFRHRSTPGTSSRCGPGSPKWVIPRAKWSFRR